MVSRKANISRRERSHMVVRNITGSLLSQMQEKLNQRILKIIFIIGAMKIMVEARIPCSTSYKSTQVKPRNLLQRMMMRS